MQLKGYVIKSSYRTFRSWHAAAVKMKYPWLLLDGGSTAHIWTHSAILCLKIDLLLVVPYSCYCFSRSWCNLTWQCCSVVNTTLSEFDCCHKAFYRFHIFVCPLNVWKTKSLLTLFGTVHDMWAVRTVNSIIASADSHVRVYHTVWCLNTFAAVSFWVIST